MLARVRSMSGCLIVLVLTLGAGTARADSPTFVSFEVNRTFVSPSFSAACGFEIRVTQTGTVKGTVFYDPSGTRIIKEIDTQPGFIVTVSSPSSGKSFSFPFATAFRFDYPNGTTPGSRAIVTASGLLDKVPGTPADAGTVTYGNGTVLFVDQNGVPIVDFGAPTAFRGSAVDPTAAIAALCTALAP